MYIVKEAKQVGILYHFTEPRKLRSIFQRNGLVSNLNDYISFTRNFNLQKISDFHDNTVRLVFDGDKLSNKYKIEPFLDRDNNINRHIGEFEERILWRKSKVLQCLFALIQVDILDKKGYEVDEPESYIKNIPISFVKSFKPYKK